MNLALGPVVFLQHFASFTEYQKSNIEFEEMISIANRYEALSSFGKFKEKSGILFWGWTPCLFLSKTCC